MNIRDFNQYMSAQQTAQFNALKVPSFGTGNFFGGGAGAVSIVNQTEDFTAVGGNSNMFAVNRGNNAYIEGGSNGNTFFSVGHNCTIMGSDKDDEILSIGQNCDISLGDGNDRICASGEGSIIDGGKGNDMLSGALTGLSYESLFNLDATAMLSKIRNASINYFTRG